jgi:hypothetical protein
MSKVYTDSIEKRTGGAAITVPASGQWIDLASAAQGDVLYHNGTSYVRLAPGTSGQFLQTSGAAANPVWGTVAAAADNTPSFGAYLAANQAYSNDTWTKITMNTEEWDTDSAFDHSTNYRFTVPAAKAGKYSFSMTSTFDDTGGTTALGKGYLSIYKNGSLFKQIQSMTGTRWELYGVQLTAVLDLAVSDYIEFYAYINQNVATGVSLGGQSLTFCSGYKLI